MLHSIHGTWPDLFRHHELLRLGQNPARIVTEMAAMKTLYVPLSDDWRRNNFRVQDVEHVFNVLGTMESCPTYFCLSTYSMD